MNVDPDGGVERRDALEDPAEESDVRSASLGRLEIGDLLHARKNQRGKSPRRAAPHDQDRRSGDRQATDTLTPLPLPDAGHTCDHFTGAVGLESVRVAAPSASAFIREDGGRTGVARHAPERGGVFGQEPTGQASGSHVRTSRSEDPLTNDGQTIKEPASSTAGDRL